jgi:hypothetical protein
LKKIKQKLIIQEIEFEHRVLKNPLYYEERKVSDGQIEFRNVSLSQLLNEGWIIKTGWANVDVMPAKREKLDTSLFVSTIVLEKEEQ